MTNDDKMQSKNMGDAVDYLANSCDEIRTLMMLDPKLFVSDGAHNGFVNLMESVLQNIQHAKKIMQSENIKSQSE